MFGKLEEISRSGEIESREPVKALMLSLCPGLGQQYSGHLIRGILLYVSLIVISWLAAALFMFIQSRLSIILFLVPVIGFIAIAVDAYRLAAAQPEGYRLKWYNRSWIYAAVFIALLFTVNPLMNIVAGSSITRAYLVSSVAMEPYLLKNDVLLVNMLAYKIGEPQRGDIVYIAQGKGAGAGVTEISEDQLIRRIIAVPGDIIVIKGRDVFVNHKKLEEEYAYFDEDNRSLMEYIDGYSFGAKVVPPGAYYVLGDNRTYSIDSRILGFIERDKIKGKITKIYWSWNFQNKDKRTIKWDRVGKPVS